MINPTFSSKSIALCNWDFVSACVVLIISMSSKYISSQIPSTLRADVTRFNTFVKAQGAVAGPKGREWNWYAIPWHENLRYLRCCM